MGFILFFFELKRPLVGLRRNKLESIEDSPRLMSPLAASSPHSVEIMGPIGLEEQNTPERRKSFWILPNRRQSLEENVLACRTYLL